MPERQPPALPPKSPVSRPAVPPVEKKSKTGCIIAAVVVGVIIIPVGIIIIGILAGLLFPAASSALAIAEKATTENTAYNLKNSIAAYFTEYRKYPGTTKGEDATYDSVGPEMAALLAEGDNPLNPRRIAFFSGKQATPYGDGGWKKGIHLNGDNSGLYDPWGTPYRITMDSDYNSQVDDPLGTGAIPQSILVYSAGPDRNFDTWDDNIRTW